MHGYYALVVLQESCLLQYHDTKFNDLTPCAIMLLNDLLDRRNREQGFTRCNLAELVQRLGRISAPVLRGIA